jgi:hypothetical protein
VVRDPEAVVGWVGVGNEEATPDRVHPQEALTRAATGRRFPGSVPVEGDREGRFASFDVWLVPRDGRAVRAQRVVGVGCVQSVGERSQIADAAKGEWRTSHTLEMSLGRYVTGSGIARVVVAVRVQLGRG